MHQIFRQIISYALKKNIVLKRKYYENIFRTRDGIRNFFVNQSNIYIINSVNGQFRHLDKRNIFFLIMK